MIPHFPLLSLITYLPIVGAVLIMLFVRGGDDNVAGVRLARQIALWTAVTTFIVSLGILHVFDASNPAFQLVEKYEWMPALNLSYHVGVDGISVWFVLISTFLTPVCMLACFPVKQRVKEFMIALLVVEMTMVGVFISLDFLLFYMFFEAVLIPMFFVVGVWGGMGRIYAAYKFFLYTFLGSVLMLIAILVMIIHTGTGDMTAIMGYKFPKEMAIWLWLAFFASFAVKSPMWPFHTWLPYAHTGATAGSIVLAGVLLKMGSYGLIRISIQMLPEPSLMFTPLVLVLSVIAIIYTSLVALVQTDIKKLIAYSSVAHMGFGTMGIFAANQQGMDGAMMVMLSHSFVAAGLFLCLAVIYDRLHTRDIVRYSGMAKNMPHYAFVFMVFMMASVGLPGTSGFVGEFLSLQGVFQMNTTIAVLAATGLILGPAYMLWFYRRLFYGPLDKADVAAMKDLSPREYVMFIPLLIIVIWMGVNPAPFRHIFAPTVTKILSDYHAQNGESK